MNQLLDAFNAWNPSSAGTRKLQGHHARRFLADHDPATVTVTEISAWLRRPEWSPNTRCAAYSSLRKLFRWYCVITAQRIDNPMLLVDRPKPKRGIPRPVPEAVLDLYRGYAGNHEDLLMFDLAALQGLRRGEIAALRTDNIDLERNVLVVCGKGDHTRVIPIHADVRERLRHKAASRSEWVFPSLGRDTHIHPRTVARRVGAMMGNSYTTHQLRHRFATAVYRSSGNDIRVTQELLGHASINTTQIYTQVDSASLVRAVAGV